MSRVTVPDLLPVKPQASLQVDERCWQLRESPRIGPLGDMRWMQRVWVVRGEDMCEFDKDLGPAWAYPLAKPFMFVSWNEYSVGEAMEQANYLREAQPEPEEPHDLMGQWFRQLDEMRNILANRSVIGPGAFIQRNYR